MPETKQYGIIYADPPWHYDRKHGSGVAENHYPTMSIEEICALPVSELAAKDSALFLWATFPQLNGVPDWICLCCPVWLSLRKKEHIFRYHGLSHSLLQENVWKPPAGNCFARCPVSGALSWQHPVSQSVPKNHPKRLHTLRPVPTRTPVFPVTDGKIPSVQGCPACVSCR